jgi:hypothetical protein
MEAPAIALIFPVREARSFDHQSFLDSVGGNSKSVNQENFISFEKT